MGGVLYRAFAGTCSTEGLDGKWSRQVLAGMPAALAIFALAEGMASLILFAALFGLANGLVTIVRGNLVPEYFGREHVGRISGAMSAIALLSRAAAPLLTAWLLLALPGYRELLLGLAVLGVLLAFVAARRPGAIGGGEG